MHAREAVSQLRTDHPLTRPARSLKVARRTAFAGCCGGCAVVEKRGVCSAENSRLARYALPFAQSIVVYLERILLAGIAIASIEVTGDAIPAGERQIS